MRVRDQGEPGTFYFHEPIEQTIESKKPPPYTDPRKDPPVNLHSVRPNSNCRMLSCRNSLIAKCPEKIAYLLDEHPTAEEIRDYHRLMHDNGLGERAVVAKRWYPKDNAITPNQWGIVLMEHHIARGHFAKWTPYTVRWSMMGDIEGAWGEDLIIIHRSLDKDTIEAIFEAQGSFV